MRFLTDAHISIEMIAVLTGQGHDVVDARLLPPRTWDEELVRIAERDQRIVVTNDRDFGTLVSALGMHLPGVVLIRMPSERDAERVARLAAVLPTIEGVMPGRYVVITRDRLRIRPMS